MRCLTPKPLIMTVGFGVGCALRSFDAGPVGLGIWKCFSKRHPSKAAETDFDAKWIELGRPYDGKPIKLGWLVHEATKHGWVWPRFWDRSTTALT